MLLMTCTGLLISCGHQQKEGEEIPIDPVPPPKVTRLAELHDSLRPVVTYLKNQPAPVIKTFPLPPPSLVFRDSTTGRYLPGEFHGHGIFTHFTSEDGLAHDYAHSAYMDKAGHLWFTTSGGGVSRFDGQSFTNFSTANGLVSNIVWSLLEDLSGNIWFTSVAGISKFDGLSFTNFTTADGLPFNDVGRVVLDPAGNLWFSTIGGGVSRFNGISFQNFDEQHGLKSKYIFSMELDRNGTMWFGTRGGGVFRLQDPAADSLHFEKFNGPASWDNDIVYSILEDREGRMWFATQYSGLYCLEQGTFKHYTRKDGLECEGINGIIEDRDGSIWVGTCKGLSEFKDSVFVTYSAKNGLPNQGIGNLVKDRSGHLWFTTVGDGIARFEGSGFSKWVDRAVSSNTSAIMQDRNDYLWFGTNGDGLIRYDGKEYISFSTDQGLPRNSINYLEEDRQGRIWFSTYYGGGLSCLELMPALPSSNDRAAHSQQVKLTNFTTAQGLPMDALYGITEDRKGNFWIATYGSGLSYFDGESFTSYTTVQGLASNDVWDVFEDSKGKIWIMYVLSDGLTLFDGKSFTNFTKAQGLPTMSVWRTIEDVKGNLWFTSEEGLILLRAAAREKLNVPLDESEYASTIVFESFSNKEGLPDNYINYVDTDTAGNLTVCSNAGYTILNGGLDAFLTPGNIIHYGANTGFPFRSVSQSFTDKDGILWVVTNSNKSGMVRMDPELFVKNADTPDLVIKNILIHNQPVIWSNLIAPAEKSGDASDRMAAIIRNEEVMAIGRELSSTERDSMKVKYADIDFDTISAWYPLPSNLILPYRHNNITFNFNAVVTTRHSMVEYQYILEGYDAGWSQPSTTSMATFGNMQEGQYIFMVRAKSPEGIWTAPVEYAFRVMPPLHRTWWAYSAYGILIGSIIFGGFRLQKRNTIRAEQQKARQKQAILSERLRISRDLHDEVGATLSGISMYSHIAKEQIKTESREVVLNSLNVMQESSGEMVNKLNDIVWLLNPEKAHLHQLVEKLETYAGKMAEIKNIQVASEIPDRISSIELPLDARRNIYLIFKEAINNAVKYSQASTLNILVKDDDHTLAFVLEDNGIGFDPDTVRRGNGLDNMSNRANEIGARLNLDSFPGKGTRLTLMYKLTI